MSRLRGDDELLDLLDIMGGHHGDEKQAAGLDCSNSSSLNATTPTGAHQPSASDEVACVPETGWNRSIWNPHTFEEGNAGAIGETAVRFVPPQEEVLRQQAVALVFSRFQVLGKELGVRLKNEMFERWQFSRKLKEGRGGDPILPAESFFDPGLDAELRELGVNKSQSRNLCCELGRASKAALKTLKKQLRGVVGGGAPSPGRSPKNKGVLAKRLDDSTYVLQLGKNKLRMNSAHYDKMKELFRRAGAQGIVGLPSRGGSASRGHDGSLPPAWIGDFHDSLFACLMRYEALQGGGFQASMGGDAFDVLLRHFGAKMECFASPFNCRYSRYCSAFKDTDEPFGSVGSFFDFRPTEGAYEANPPFVRDVILKMANHMDSLLEATSKALTFVVIVPCWEDSAGWKRLRDSVFLSKHIKLDQKDHGYCEGKQHLRRNRYRLASFHTSVFFLQTKAARQQQAEGTLEHACRELERAFDLRQEGDGSSGGGDGGGDGEGDVDLDAEQRGGGGSGGSDDGNDNDGNDNDGNDNDGDDGDGDGGGGRRPEVLSTEEGAVKQQQRALLDDSKSNNDNNAGMAATGEEGPRETEMETEKEKEDANADTDIALKRAKKDEKRRKKRKRREEEQKEKENVEEDTNAGADAAAKKAKKDNKRTKKQKE
ncbi:unnamed protein product [Pylaiella littoralis]